MIQNCFLLLGPLLPMKLNGHSMVKLGNGQTIIGGVTGWQNNYQNKIYLLTCSNRNCLISLLNRELSVAKENIVAIPIPDTISGCVTGGKQDFRKKLSYIRSGLY